MTRCVACNAPLSGSKRKPASTFAGSMNSVFADRIEGFPTNEEEDLCSSCLGSIRNYNSDQNDQFGIYNKLFSNVNDGDELFLEEDPESLASPSDYVEDLYQGYRTR